MKKRTTQHRGVVLRLHHAAAIHRWLEYVMDGRKFDNPIVASETLQEALTAKAALEAKLLRSFAISQVR